MASYMHSTATTNGVIAASSVRFGTSGARGPVSELTDAVCFAYALAFLRAIGVQPGGKVGLGMDLRPSSPRIAAACAAAIRHGGLAPVFFGRLPTPALAYYADRQGIPAIMITGSHIPFDRNGIKFYRPEGEITKADEAAILSADAPLPAALPSMPLPEVDPTAGEAYARRYVDFFPAGALAGLRLGFYQHSSVARDSLTGLLQRLGAEVVALGRTDDFVPIDTEAVAATDVRRAQAWAAEERFDALISTDGDADRPLLGDEQGRWLRGDVVGILCARLLGAAAVAAPVSCNTALEACGAFSEVRRTRIGSPYVIAGMAELAAEGYSPVVGFEANGGFLVGSRVIQAGRTLSALPTRDAVLPMLTLLVAARQQGVPLSALAADLPQRFTASDRLQDFAPERSRALLARLAASPAAQEALLEPVCGTPLGQDETDGLRLTFANGENIHLRPSGNAPELRCYAEAATPQRAESVVAAVLQRIRAEAETSPSSNS